MTATLRDASPVGASPVPGRRSSIDGATLTGAFFLILLIVPEGMVIAAIPIKIQVAVVVALLLGLLWLPSHFVHGLGMAKGRSAVRSALFAYLCAHLVTFGIATRFGLPGDEAKSADSGIIKVFALVGVALFICDGVRGRNQVDRVVRTLTAAMAGAALVGLLQFAVDLDLVRYFSYVPGLRSTGDYDSIQLRNGFRRPAGTSNHPIEYGLICAMGLPLAVHCGFAARDAGRPAVRWWFCVALLGAGSFVAVSRTAILCLAVAGLAMVLTLPGWRKLYVLVLGMALTVVAGVTVPGLLGTLFKLFANAGDDPSVQGRTSDYPLVWLEVADHPWFGRGFGTYFSDRYVLLDNQYLGTLVENGYVGLACLVAVILAGVAAALRTYLGRRSPALHSLGAALLASMLVGATGAATFDMLGFPQAALLFTGLIGLAGATVRVAAEEKRDERAADGRRVSA